MPTALYLKGGSFYSSVTGTDSAHPFGPSTLRANAERLTRAVAIKCLETGAGAMRRGGMLYPCA
jgi:hypothetical protein